MLNSVGLFASYRIRSLHNIFVSPVFKDIETVRDIFKKNKNIKENEKKSGFAFPYFQEQNTYIGKAKILLSNKKRRQKRYQTL